MKSLLVVGLAVLVGVLLASYDLRPAGIAALVVATVGALIGFGIARASRVSPAR